MNKNIFVTAVLILFVVIIFWTIGQNAVNRNTNSLLNPEPTPQLTTVPASTPKTFKFDASTDLKKELDSINPQVLDNDFE